MIHDESYTPQFTIQHGEGKLLFQIEIGESGIGCGFLVPLQYVSRTVF